VLDANSGERLYTVPIGNFIAVLVVDVPTNRVFEIGDDTLNIVLLDAASGAKLGTLQAPLFTAAVDPSTGRLFGTIGTAWANLWSRACYAL
jgi:hypothetical protein